MGLHEVKNAIREKTKLEVDAQLQAAHAESQRIITEAQEQIKHKREENAAKTADILEALERKELASAQFARKSILLDEKRKAIDAVFTQTQAALAKQDANTRNKLVTQLAAKAKADVQVATVRCNSKDAATLKKLFAGATVVNDDTLSGGFIADDTSGVVRVDYSYDTLIATLREQRMAELTKILFE